MFLQTFNRYFWIFTLVRQGHQASKYLFCLGRNVLWKKTENKNKCGERFEKRNKYRIWKWCITSGLSRLQKNKSSAFFLWELCTVHKTILWSMTMNNNTILSCECRLWGWTVESTGELLWPMVSVFFCSTWQLLKTTAMTQTAIPATITCPAVIHVWYPQPILTLITWASVRSASSADWTISWPMSLWTFPIAMASVAAERNNVKRTVSNTVSLEDSKRSTHNITFEWMFNKPLAVGDTVIVLSGRFTYTSNRSALLQTSGLVNPATYPRTHNMLRQRQADCPFLSSIKPPKHLS